MEFEKSQIDLRLLSPDEKKRQLYDKQVKMLKAFLEKKAITKQQFDKSFGDLTEKMGMN